MLLDVVAYQRQYATTHRSVCTSAPCTPRCVGSRAAQWRRRWWRVVEVEVEMDVEMKVEVEEEEEVVVAVVEEEDEDEEEDEYEEEKE